MLYTRNAFLFRKFFKEERSDNYKDLNFIGSLHKEGNKNIEGFASLTVGNRKDIGKYLSTVALNVAADDQAIYELIQNADDSKSSFFSVSYNEKYLLCINNGNYFSDNDMSAIINVAGNFKEGEDIGTFGIGFKILHRLVGTDDGRDAIINNYAGPIIFSWNEYSQFIRFIEGEPIGVYGWGKTKEEYTYEKDIENAWLVKILYTCFPSNIGERIKLKDFDTQGSKFDKDELREMRSFLRNSLQNVNLKEDNYLKNGSIFFLKLGEGKSKFLDDGIEKIKSGLSYSFKFLNSLKKIYINGQEIKEQRVESYDKFYSLDSAEFLKINPKNKNRDIKFSFAFYRDYRKAENLRNGLVPNLYTFFSMDEEKNGLNFLLHCNAFDMNNDRRKLQANSQINETLLPIIANEITQYIENQKDKNRELFLSLYANLLFSNEPRNKVHINNYFFKFLKDYLHQNIPTQNGYSGSSENVKIKNTRLIINPADLDCSEIEWFAWSKNDYEKEIIEESKKTEKLGLKEWDIVDLLKYAIKKGHIEKVNAWVQKLEIETSQIFAEEKQQKETNSSQELLKKNKPYLSLLNELNDNFLKSNADIISQIKLFKFNDGNYYSLNDILLSTNLLFNDTITFPNNVVRLKNDTTQKFKELSIWEILNYKLALTLSKIDISKYQFLYSFYKEKVSYLALFQKITAKIKIIAQSEEKRLYPDEKKKLFLILLELSKDAEGKIDTKRIRDIEMFSDTKKRIIPLRKLIKGDSQVPNWLVAFKMNQYEDMPELLEYCTKQDEIYKNIILEYWEAIISYERLNINYFYPELLKYYEFSKDKELLESKKLPFIATQKGFKRIDEVFFHSVLINLESSKYRSLQDLVSNVFQKELARFNVLSSLVAKDSPLRITINQSISPFLVNTDNLEYHEVEALLTFAKLTKENIFEQIYIESRNSRFSIVKHSKSVFQYFSNDKEVINFLVTNTTFKLLPATFKSEALDLGLLEGDKLYAKVLEQGFDKNLLPIIEKCGITLKEAFLLKIPSILIEDGKIYDESSFEQRVLKLAIQCKKEKEIAAKISIYNSYKIAQLTYQNEVKFTINSKSYSLHLANILPNYKGISDIASQVQKQFKGFEKQFKDNFFSSIEIEKSIISMELQKIKSITDIEQFAFVLFQSKTITNLFPNFQIQIKNRDILDYCFDKKIDFLDAYISNLNDFLLKDKIYLPELALETEKLPEWVLNWLQSTDKQEKLSFLSTLGVHIENSNVCAIRRFFQTGQNIDVQANVVTLSQGLLLNTLKWLQGNTFNTSESTKLDALKQIYSRINYTQDIPLLYVSQITDSEILYNLEVSTEIKYYFEAPQKEYSQKIFAVLQSKGFKLIELNYCKHWQTSIKPEKIATTEVLDIEKIKQNCKTWNDSAYNSWEAKSKYPIFIYEGDKIPYKTIFHGTDIDIFEKERSKKDGNVIYVSKSVSDIKQELLNEKLVLTDDLLKLYSLNQSNNNEVISVIKEHNLTVAEIKDLIRIKEWLNRPRPTFEPKTDAEIKAISNISNTGVKGEDIVNQYLISKFGAERVIWASQKGEARYDFEVLATDKKTIEMYVDAKATITSEYEADKIPILIRTRAWNFLKDNKEKNFFIARIFDINNAKVEDVKLIQVRLKEL